MRTRRELTVDELVAMNREAIAREEKGMDALLVSNGRLYPQAIEALKRFLATAEEAQNVLDQVEEVEETEELPWVKHIFMESDDE